MIPQNTRRTIAALSTVAVVGLGAAGWIWVHRKANHELIEALEDARAHLPAGVEFTWGKAIALPTTHGARLTDVVLKDPDGTVSAAMIELIGASVGPTSTTDGNPPDASLSVEHNPLHFDHVLAHTLHITGPAGEMHAKRLSLDGLLLPPPGQDQIAALTMDHGELTDATVVSADNRTSARAASFILDQYGLGRLSRLTVGKLELQTADHPSRDLLVGKLVSDGSDLAAAMQGALNGQGILFHEGNQSIMAQDVKLQGETGGPGSSIAPLFAIETAHAHIDTTGQKSRVTESLSHFRVWPNGPQGILVKSLGYTKFAGNVVLNALVDFSADVAHITQLDIKAPDWGRLDIAADLVNLAAPTGQMPQPQLAHLDLTWSDGGLVSHIMNSAAISQGMDPDAYVMLLRRSLTPPGTAPDSAGAQLSDYLANPDAGPLTAMLAPPQPLPLPALATLALLPAHPEVATTLGLTVQAPSKDRTAPPPAMPDPNMTTDEPEDPSILAPAPPPAPPGGKQ
ncbi:3-demethylubiquinone-9 3-methyltransferase [Acetobacter conturbans]|uniref:3-demethylubiquinone-9 3-methyltransferase n=1 Tax=Acetobacter conturbans TaxID=1737472 RepID=A0ABX0JWB2_9PROT|nr:3-demethylubiquinone-9 3-methyltransferase [Acetobacter conturbans]NHN87147.1 3-demethylubiquinone-9 3-methyltransferase [Acetobacter conturbans]